MTAAAEAGSELAAALAPAGSRACAIWISSASSSRLPRSLLAVVWAFPLYWGLVTTFKPEYEVVRPGVQLWPEHFTLEAYVHVLMRTKIGIWYVNSLITSAAVTGIVVTMALGAGYAISQLKFPGRRLFWWTILASFMIPIPSLTVTHFILMSQFHWINTLPGVIAPQLIAPAPSPSSSTSSSSTPCRRIFARRR